MSQTNWRHFDFLLLGAVAMLTIFGITMIRSTVAGNIELTAANLPQRQLIFAVLGFIVIFIMSAIDYRLWASMSGTMYLVTFVILAVLNVVAAAVFGSARWFKTAIVNIQPSEIAKIVVVITLANFFMRNQGSMDRFRNVIRSLGLTMGLVIWVLLQPNLSTSILILFIWFAMAWVSGMRVKHVALLAGIGLVVLLISIPLFPVLVDAGILQEYQVKRVTNFLAPDPEARHGDNYNIDQAVISIGSGGLLGQGYGHGTQVQLRFLKVRWSDYIFSAMAQEFGFVGTVLILLLEIFVIYRCLLVSRHAADTFGALIAFGVATLIGFQAMVNVGVNLKLLPATGLPLPFISYGGSSLLSLLLGVGLVESVILRHKTLEF